MSDGGSGIWRVHSVPRLLGETDDDALRRAAKSLSIGLEDVEDWRVAQRSIDSRGNRPPRFILHLDVVPRAGSKVRPARGQQIRQIEVPTVEPTPTVSADSARPIVLGMGPCGLFAALQLVEAIGA